MAKHLPKKTREKVNLIQFQRNRSLKKSKKQETFEVSSNSAPKKKKIKKKKMEPCVQNVVFNGTMKRRKNWICIGYSAQKLCKYWVHTKCCNIIYPPTNAGEVAWNERVKDHFFAKKHMPKY